MFSKIVSFFSNLKWKGVWIMLLEFITEIIKDYYEVDGKSKEMELLGFRKNSVYDSIKEFLNPEDKPDHLKRRHDETIEDMKLSLLKIDWYNCSSQEDIRNKIIENRLSDFGQLAINDTSVMIMEGIEAGNSERWITKIYIQSGSLEGALYLRTILQGKLEIKSEVKGNLEYNFLFRDQLPDQLKEMHPFLVEDFLCVYRKELEILAFLAIKKINIQQYRKEYLLEKSFRLEKNYKNKKIGLTEFNRKQKQLAINLRGYSNL